MFCVNVVSISIFLFADEAHLFVEDHNPDPTLHSHLEHTNDEMEGVACGNEGQMGSEEDKESDGSESDGTPHMLDGVVREKEVGPVEEGVEVGEEGSNHKLKENTKGIVKQKKRKGVRTVQRVIGPKQGEMDVEGEVSRCRVSRRRLVHRTRQVSVWQRVRFSAARIQRTSRKN